MHLFQISQNPTIRHKVRGNSCSCVHGLQNTLFYFADRWAITLRIVKLFGIKIDRGGRKKKNTYLNLSLRFNDSLLPRTTCCEGCFYSHTNQQCGLPLVYTVSHLPALCREIYFSLSIYMKSTSLISLKAFWKCILWVSH